MTSPRGGGGGAVFALGGGEKASDPDKVQLPRHVHEILYRNKTRFSFEEKHWEKPPKGRLAVSHIEGALDHVPEKLPWDKRKAGSSYQRSKAQYVKKHRQRGSTGTPEVYKYEKFDKIIAQNVHNKIAFVDICPHHETIPHWATSRLQTACMSARFEMPSNRKLLEDMTPLQFLAKYTRMYKQQFRRYSNIFEKFKIKLQDHMTFEKFQPAMSRLFENRLSDENFSILSTVLFIDEKTLLDKETFVGICCFADRLYWTSFLLTDDNKVNTRDSWGPNRQALECVDFENLKRKLEGLELSKEMKALLYSLA